MADDKPIIVIKKKGGHGGHHGGAWKVAYADFVTAMMAFFLVMWLVNSAAEPTRENIASYFRRPGLFLEGSGAPLSLGEAGILDDAYVPPNIKDENYVPGQVEDGIRETDEYLKGIGEAGQGVEGLSSKDLSEAPDLKAVAEELLRELSQTAGIEDLLEGLAITLTPEGLYIEIMDTEKSSMFNLGGAKILSKAETAFAKIAALLSPLPNRLDILGHTDSLPFSARHTNYSNWELSADRANSARRLLEAKGINSKRIASVVGRADRELRDAQNPNSPTNRRITMVVRHVDDTGTPNAGDPAILREEERVRAITTRPAPPVQTKSETKLEQAPKESIIQGVFPDSPVIGPSDIFSGF
jgi:chemotaxis protein MotB